MLSKESKKLKKINRINIKSQLEHLTGFFTMIILCSVIAFAVYYKVGFEMFLFVVIVSSLMTLSVLFVHIQYLIKNIGFKIIVDDENKLTCYIADKEIVITNENIVSIEKNISNTYNGPKGHLPTDSYFYSRIALKDGNNIIITSLLMSEFEFFKEKTIIKKRFIAIII